MDGECLGASMAGMEIRIDSVEGLGELKALLRSNGWLEKPLVGWNSKTTNLTVIQLQNIVFIYTYIIYMIYIYAIRILCCL